MILDEYIEAKYTGGGPGSDRFEPDPTEVHASQLSDCQRKRFWKFDRGHSSDASPYFELGRVYELLYGAALAYAHDPGIDDDDLKENQPWDVGEMSERVRQDLQVAIEFDDFEIVGECDWVVFAEGGRTDIESVEVTPAGDRIAVTEDGERLPYEGDVEKVVETKTKKDLDWVREKGPDGKHIYQVYPYMHALDCRGELAYMQRNDLEELVVPLEYDEATWLDCVSRAMRHSENMCGGSLPPTTPLDDSECRWCPFYTECRSVGGSAWE